MIKTYELIIYMNYNRPSPRIKHIERKKLKTIKKWYLKYKPRAAAIWVTTHIDYKNENCSVSESGPALFGYHTKKFFKIWGLSPYEDSANIKIFREKNGYNFINYNALH